MPRIVITPLLWWWDGALDFPTPKWLVQSKSTTPSLLKMGNMFWEIVRLLKLAMRLIFVSTLPQKWQHFGGEKTCQISEGKQSASVVEFGGNLTAFSCSCSRPILGLPSVLCMALLPHKRPNFLFVHFIHAIPRFPFSHLPNRKRQRKRKKNPSLDQSCNWIKPFSSSKNTIQKQKKEQPQWFGRPPDWPMMMKQGT